MQLGNASLTRIYAGNVNDYGEPLGGAGAVKWTGEASCKVIDRYRTVPRAGGVDRYQEVVVWLPARLVANDGGYLALQVGDTLEVVQDGVTFDYTVNSFYDSGQRNLATRSLIKTVCDRRAVV